MYAATGPTVGPAYEATKTALDPLGSLRSDSTFSKGILNTGSALTRRDMPTKGVSPNPAQTTGLAWLSLTLYP